MGNSRASYQPYGAGKSVSTVSDLQRLCREHREFKSIISHFEVFVAEHGIEKEWEQHKMMLIFKGDINESKTK